MVNRRLHANNAALLLMDHQVGVMGWVQSSTLKEMTLNALRLAKTASTFEMPVVITTQMEHDTPGAPIAELTAILPTEMAGRINRTSITRALNAMDDERFAAALRATKRNQLVIAGAAIDISVEFTARALLKEGFDVHVVVDAGGWSAYCEDIEQLERMQSLGIALLSTRRAVALLTGLRCV